MFVILDIGGTNCRIGVFEDLKSNKPKIIKYIKSDLLEIKKEIHEIISAKIDAIALAIAGSLDLEKGMLINSVNLKLWENINLIDYFTKEFKCPVFIQNDTFVAALGESLAISSEEDFWYVNWGSGIGGALARIVDGKRMVFSSEIGHHSLGSQFPTCRCGQIGCWDSLASGKALMEKFNTHPSNLILSEWKSIIPFMVQGLINILSINPVDTVVMGGGVSINQPEIIDLISKKVNDGLKIVKSPKFKIAKFKDYSALYGGLELIKTKL